MSNNRFQDTSPSLAISGEINSHEHELQPLDPQDFPGCYDRHERELPLQRMANTSTSQSPSSFTPTQTYEYTHPERRYINGQENVTRENLLPQSHFSVSAQSSQASTKSRTSRSAAPVCTPANAQTHTQELSSPRFWAWEISASILSIACMASVVGVLFYEQDKPLNKWGLGQTYLSPNVVVSFLGTLGKSACLVVVAESVSQLKWLHFHKRSQELNDLQLFDAASRGPWGALQLVFRKHGSAFLAKCASVVILASLLIDPFIQSVFQFPSILTPVEGVYPTILSSHIYDPSSLDYRYDQCYGAAMVSAPMQAAILAPIWNATRNPSLPCKFERCEWPTITTLGVCSECIDLTDTVVPTCTENPHVIQKYIDCNYTLPRSINTFNVVFGVSGGASVSEPYSTIWNSAMEDAPIDLMRDAYSKIESGFVSSQPAQIVNFTFVQLDPVDVKHSPLNLTSPEPLKKAMQCTIHFCARTFETPYYSNFTASPLAGKSVGLVTAAEGTTTGNKAKILLGLGPENKTAVSTNTSFQINYCDYQDLTLYLQDLFSAEMDSQGIMESTTDASTNNMDFESARRPTRA